MSSLASQDDNARKELVTLAAQVCEAPAASFVFFDEVGDSVLLEDVAASHDLFEVEDLTRSGRWADDPMMRADPSRRFFAGVPVGTRASDRKGELFVTDTRARRLTDAQAQGLRTLGRQVMALLELRRSESGFRMLFEQAGEGIFVTDPAARFLDANEAACELTGYTHAELAGLEAADILQPEEHPRVGPEIARLVHCHRLHTGLRHRRVAPGKQAVRIEAGGRPARGVQAVQLSRFRLVNDREEVSADPVVHRRHQPHHGVGGNGRINGVAPVLQNPRAGLRRQHALAGDDAVRRHHHRAGLRAILGEQCQRQKAEGKRQEGGRRLFHDSKSYRHIRLLGRAVIV